MTSRYGVEADKVRFLVGVGTSELSDSDINTQIEDAEYEAEQLMTTKFGQNENTEWLTSQDGSEVLMASKTPVNRIVEVTIGGTVVTPKYVKFNRQSGKLILTNEAEKSRWNDNEPRNNYIKYKYGKLDESTTETTSTAAVNTGTNVTIGVGTVVGFETNSPILIVSSGTDSWIGHDEITVLTGTSADANTINAPLQYDYEIGARVVKMQTPSMFKQLVETLAAIRGALNMVGSTYTFATHYSIPEKSVTKGVPYPHFEKVLNRLTSRRDYLLERYRPVPHVG